jgi:hypothetical protein
MMPWLNKLRGTAIFLALFLGAVDAQSGSTGAPKHTREDGFRYISGCARGGNWARVENSKAIHAMYKAVSQSLGNYWLPVYSCMRSQAKQDDILRANHCAPRFGSVKCSGRIAANVSEHTRGTAGDFFVPAGSPKTLCRILSQARAQANGGRGGITFYGTSKVIDPETGHMAMMSSLHLDIGTDGNIPGNPAQANWGECERFLGEGHCKRTKFRRKKAELEEQLAKAKLLGSRETVGRLEKVLASLSADCKPGGLKCRDNYKK